MPASLIVLRLGVLLDTSTGTILDPEKNALILT